MIGIDHQRPGALHRPGRPRAGGGRGAAHRRPVYGAIPGYVSVPVVMELVWVLTGAYRYEKPVVASVIHQILRTTEFVVEDRDTTWSALREFEAGPADFADCLIAHRNQARGCSRTYTFDRKAARGRHFALVP